MAVSKSDDSTPPIKAEHMSSIRAGYKRNLPLRKKHNLPGSFPMVKLEGCEFEPREEKVKNPFDGTSNGVCGAGAFDQEIMKVDMNGEHDKNLEVEQKVSSAHDDSGKWVSNRRELVQETVKIEENGENEKNLEFEENTNSVKEVKSILKQLREELVKVEPNSDVVSKPDHETHQSVSDETGMKLLSEPKVVKERKYEGEENGSVTCESGVAPNGLLGKLSQLDSISSNLKMLRKQNKHGESSSSSLDNFD